LSNSSCQFVTITYETDNTFVLRYNVLPCFVCRYRKAGINNSWSCLVAIDNEGRNT